ncbi:hypothetical protein HDIA_1924 [Hartmannibacter diazotrophicus]|uniref:Antifreeze protein, type I n=1 Tax=Hartmannibacter diazotrophicus TaxID=1482074 RepID=A0A2C9D7F3_9HYPH|nr:antifreeze protein [Hartmannibacter diazotrophicus]SON55465.1 hypothetical protein HDIA_1924 [Hartmannibacter diazotrophicus]
MKNRAYKVFTPLPFHTYWQSNLDVARLAFESQMVIGLRLASFAGMWQMPAGEARRMISEKPPAFAQAAMAAGSAAITGASPERVVGAAVKSLRTHTSSNLRRLARPKSG